MECLTPHIWDEDPRFILDVGLAPVSPTFSACGENLNNLSTLHPQKMWKTSVFYILAGLKTTPPNMGGMYWGKLEHFDGFSTAPPVYPQIFGSYPQISCLVNRF